MRICGRHALGAALATAAAATGLIGLTAGPASAGWSAGPLGYVCLCAAGRATGAVGKIQYADSDLLKGYPSGGARSLCGDGASCAVMPFTGTGHTGISVRLPRQTGPADLLAEKPPGNLGIALNRRC